MQAQAQVAISVTCRGQKLIQSNAGAANYGERGSNCTLSHRQNYCYHRIGNSHRHPAPESNFTQHTSGRAGKSSEKSSTKQGRQAPMLHHLGFSYLASSFHYILRKVKAFYNGFLGDPATESRIASSTSEAPMVEPYFSIPVVLPHP
ncbi:hypothetical protein G2W53_020287 [Senna tora]|uniref:Uncharacterized protein n=1 Tax=Senna tora TaxID=362788 RepID=A0A834TV51_9FABA|nr:hypothetical protein G2W53_020287 [Senna tora]